MDIFDNLGDFDQCLFDKTNESRLPWHDITSSDTFLNDLDDLVEKFVTDITVVSREESLQKKLHFERHSSPQFGNNIGIILWLLHYTELNEKAMFLSPNINLDRYLYHHWTSL